MYLRRKWGWGQWEAGWVMLRSCAAHDCPSPMVKDSRVAPCSRAIRSRGKSSTTTGTCRDTPRQWQGTQTERPDHIQAFKYKQVPWPWIFGRGLKQWNALWQNAEKTWSRQWAMGMPSAHRRRSETYHQLYQQTISFLFWLDFLVCVFTIFGNI